MKISIPLLKKLNYWSNCYSNYCLSPVLWNKNSNWMHPWLGWQWKCEHQ